MTTIPNRRLLTSLFMAAACVTALQGCGGTEQGSDEFYGETPGSPASSGGAADNGGSNGNAAPGVSSSGSTTSSGSTSSSSGSTSSGGPLLGTEPSDPALNGIIAAHNLARSRVSPAATSPIPALNWSDSDAAVAKAYAAQCKFEHNPNRGPRGENLYASAGTKNTPSAVVGSWESEKADYNYSSNTCAPGKACGHYTQVVWAKTSTVGCAVQQCTANSPFGGGSWEIWVCDYSAPGNFNGQRPY